MKRILHKPVPLHRIAQWLDYADVIDYREDDYIDSLKETVYSSLSNPIDYIEEVISLCSNHDTYYEMEPLAAKEFSFGVRIGSC